MRLRLSRAVLVIAGVALGGAAAWLALPRSEPAATASLTDDSLRPFMLAQADTPAATPIPAERPRATTPTPAFSAEQRTEIDSIIGDYLAAHPDFIRDYLIANPEVISDAINELQRRQEAEQVAMQSEAIKDNRDLLLHSPRQVVLGNPNGDVTLVEFFDYNCTYCKRSLADMARLIDEDSNLRVVLKEFPVLGPGSVEAAQVATALNMVAPAKYGDFHDELLGGRAPADANRALAVAGDLGVDIDKLKAAMSSPEVDATVNESYALASSLGLTGTPSYVVGDQVVVGAVGYEALKARIEEARAACAAAGAASC